MFDGQRASVCMTKDVSEITKGCSYIRLFQVCIALEKYHGSLEADRGVSIHDMTPCTLLGYPQYLCLGRGAMMVVIPLSPMR